MSEPFEANTPEITRTPSIAVTIGGQERVYHAFVTTAVADP
jgi:hypothetical protein